jgi:hypothetical protein
MRFLAAFFLALLALPTWGQSLFAFSCGEDSHIDAAKRETIDTVATAFASSLLGTDPGAAFDAFSKEAQQTTARGKIAATGALFTQQFHPTNVSIQHTYLIKLSGKSPGRVICATDLTKPDGWESLGAADDPEQAHVLMSADMTNGHVAIAVWLAPEENVWKVRSFWLNVSSLGEKDSVQLWELANVQKADGHNFNAALLYAAAAQTANRGPNFQMGITQSISQSVSDLAIPADLEGPAPFIWKNGDVTFKVLSYGPIAIGGKFYVIVLHEVAPWNTDSQVDGWNRQVLSYLKQRFPEYSDVFAGIVVRAKERDGNGLYGTVEELPTSP